MKTKLKLVCENRSFCQSPIKKVLIFLLLAAVLIFGYAPGTFASWNRDIKKISPVILPDIKIVKGVVKRGDTLSSILNRYCKLKSIYEISRLSNDVFSLKRIRKGQPYRIILQDEELSGFEYEIDTEERLVVQKGSQGFSIYRAPINYEVNLEVVTSTIRSSLFEAVRKSGERNELARDLSDIFAWDIDFIRDIQTGDQFRVLVEKRYREGKLCGYGKIQAAFFMNNGKLFKAFLHKDSEGVTGYYDENGNSLQKAFLKAPVAFSRISSKFTKRRLHPIFKEYRSHPGVDYAAPKGTPIKTVGDGIVTKVSFQKGLGNYITIRHFNGYITGYNHMSRFAKGMKKNKRVLQGEVIGYVGMTGYATGPHLDFRMKKDGKLIDPLKHKAPSASPVKADEMEQFLARAVELSRKMVNEDKLAALR